MHRGTQRCTQRCILLDGMDGRCGWTRRAREMAEVQSLRDVTPRAIEGAKPRQDLMEFSSIHNRKKTLVVVACRRCCWKFVHLLLLLAACSLATACQRSARGPRSRLAGWQAWQMGLPANCGGRTCFAERSRVSARVLTLRAFQHAQGCPMAGSARPLSGRNGQQRPIAVLASSNHVHEGLLQRARVALLVS